MPNIKRMLLVAVTPELLCGSCGVRAMGCMKYFVPWIEAGPFCFTPVTDVQVATSLVEMK